jgi:hypothetical protein
MDVDPYEWGPASVTFPDWSGTAQIDEKMTGDVDVYSLTGVDPEEWVIIGLDFGGGESGLHLPHVIAVRTSDLGDKHIYELPEIKAVDIQINNGVDPFELLKAIIHVMEMRFRVRSVVGTTITITELLDG